MDVCSAAQRLGKLRIALHALVALGARRADAEDIDLDLRLRAGRTQDDRTLLAELKYINNCGIYDLCWSN